MEVPKYTSLSYLFVEIVSLPGKSTYNIAEELTKSLDILQTGMNILSSPHYSASRHIKDLIIEEDEIMVPFNVKK